MAEYIKIKLNDERDEGLRKFANLLDPNLFNDFIQKLKSTDEKRTLEELIEAWLDGS